MPEYIASFTTGFGKVVSAELPKALNGAKILNIYDGLIHFSYHGHIEKLSHLAFLNNIYFLIKEFKKAKPRNTGKTLRFEDMIKDCTKLGFTSPVKCRNFRIRYSKENQFCKVDRVAMQCAERHITKNTGMTVNRTTPDCEFWYIIRSEGVAYFAQLISKREATEKNLARGELRPEVASLICAFAKIRDGFKICDPFCGHCGLEKEFIKSRHKITQIYASDLNDNLVSEAKLILNAKKHKNLDIRQADARNLKHIRDSSINAIITDPPWGYYEEIPNIKELYEETLDEFIRILLPGGHLVLLSARKQEFEEACEVKKLRIKDRIDTLVNGKKAAVYFIKVNKNNS